MKAAIKNILILFAVILLWKLYFIPPKNLYTPSKNIKESKRIKAYIGECHIFKVDTLTLGYKFPIDKIWIEKVWSLGRNKIGIVIPIVEDTKIIRFDINSEDPFFKMYYFSENWVIKDSLTHSINSSFQVPSIKCYYNQGDTAIFKVFRLNSDSSNVWRDHTMELLFKIYTVCDLQ